MNEDIQMLKTIAELIIDRYPEMYDRLCEYIARESEIKSAFIDVTRGLSAHDIAGDTGLSMKRCEEIANLSRKLR